MSIQKKEESTPLSIYIVNNHIHKNTPSFTGKFNLLSKLPLPAKQKSVQSIEHNPHTPPPSARFYI